MNIKVAKIIIPAIALLIIISSCGDKKQDSPFADILAQPPYASITDSINQFPGNEELYFRRAVLLNTNNYPEPALADFQKAWSLKKEVRFALGISTLLLENKPEEATRFLLEATKQIPNSLLLELSLARAYNGQQKIKEALAVCDQLLQQKPDQVDVLKMKAELLSTEGKEQEATATLEKAYQLTPYDVELNYILALKYAETGNTRVLLLCDSLIKADSADQHAEPYYYKGIYYAGKKEQAKAITLFDEAISHDYTFLESYIEKGSLLYDMKKYPDAIKVFNLALNVSPDYADTYYWIGKCQEAMNQKEEAKLNYQRAVGLDKNFKEARDALEKMGN